MGNPVPQRILGLLYEIGQEQSVSKEKWWILLRWALLGVVILATLMGNQLIHLQIPSRKVFYLCAITGLLNTFLHYYVLVRKKAPSGGARPVRGPTYYQFATDWVFLSLIFHYTGGIASPLLFYFLFHLILSGVVLERWACFFYLTLIALTINGLALLELGGYVPHIYLASFISRDVQNNPFSF